jgi:hypothetical protein
MYQHPQPGTHLYHKLLQGWAELRHQHDAGWMALPHHLACRIEPGVNSCWGGVCWGGAGGEGRCNPFLQRTFANTAQPSVSRKRVVRVTYSHWKVRPCWSWHCRKGPAEQILSTGRCLWTAIAWHLSLLPLLCSGAPTCTRRGSRPVLS